LPDTSAKAIGRKQPHRLHLATSPAELEQALAAHDLRIEDLLANHGVQIGDSQGLLAVGSIAEQLGTPSSDLDLLVLTDTPWDRDGAPAMVMEWEASRETVTYKNGVEINLELVTREDLRRALNAFLEVGPLLFDERGLSSMPIIGMAERHLLHRLRSGWPLRGEAIVERWRDEFLVVLYPFYLALLHFVGFNEMREDAAALEGPDDGSFAIAARMTAAEGLSCLLALQGVTNPKPKWVMRLADRFLAQSHPDLHRELAKLMFLPRSQHSDKRSQVLHTLDRIGSRLTTRLREQSELKPAVEFVTVQIDYVEG